MRRSDIFDDFVKIAQEKGLISTSSPEEIKKKLENNPRMDSLDISAIEALYGVKPDMPKEMKYEKNIIEDAHPNAVVVSPSYDKLNGLVENLNERQNIIMHIVNKVPDGHLVNRKYAEKQLLMTLVRIANDLDNQNKDELRVLADTCLEQTAAITKKGELITTAAVSAAVALAIVIPVAAILGGLYLQQHMGFINEGVEKNHEKLIAEIDDLLNSSVSWGVGQQYTQDFLRQMTQFKSELMKIYSEYQKVAGVINTLETPRTGKDLMILASAPQTTQVIDAYNSFKKLFDNFKPYLEQVERNFKKETYKIRQIQDKGWLSRVVDWTQILHGGWGLIADDFDDVVRAIAPYKRSIEETLTVLNEAETFEKDAQNKIQSALGTTTPEFGAEEPIPPAQQPGTTFVSSRPRTDIEGDAAELERELESVRIPISL